MQERRAGTVAHERAVGMRFVRVSAKGGQGVWRRAVELAILTGVVVGMTGCETNMQRSARLEKVARAERLAHPLNAGQVVNVTRESPQVKVVETAVVHSENGTAAVVTLENVSRKPLRDAPIAITVTGKGGVGLYKNNAAGLEPSLVSVPLLEPSRQTVWVDDQVQAASAPTGVNARVGESPSVSGEPPNLTVEGAHSFEDPSSGIGEEGTVVNRSRVSQQQLVVYAVARRAGRVVAAGRAVLPEAKAGARTNFQVFFIGSPQGAKLEVSAPPTTLG